MNFTDQQGHPVLWQAAVHGHVEVVNTLLTNGAKPDPTDQTGESLMVKCCIRGLGREMPLELASGLAGLSAVQSSRLFRNSSLTLIALLSVPLVVPLSVTLTLYCHSSSISERLLID